MRATWDPTASLHHGHTAITSTAAAERKTDRREMWGREREKRKSRAQTAVRGGECAYTSGIGETERHTDMGTERDLHVASARLENAPLLRLIFIFFPCPVSREPDFAS